MRTLSLQCITIKNLPLQGGGATNLHLPCLPSCPSSPLCYSSESPHSINQQMLHRRSSQNRTRVGYGLRSCTRIVPLRWPSFGWVLQQNIAPRYDSFIQGMADISATLTVGLNCFDTFSHGPKNRLVFRAKEAETMFEAVLSLLYFQGFTSPPELTQQLSALSSVFFIGKTGVQSKESFEIVMFTNVLSSK